MSKFKAGDKVFWEDDFGEASYHVVSEVVRDRVWFQDGDWMPESSLYFTDEPLLEMPNLVRYECNQNPGNDFLEVHKFLDFIFIGVTEDGKDSQIELTVDSALQLSSDLLRMAMDLKRKQQKEEE